MALIAQTSFGGAGIMEIHDTGSTITMRIRSTDAQTNSDRYSVRVYVNGGWSGWWGFHYPAGANWLTLWSGNVSYSQSVAFAISGSGTWGFGSGGELWGAISRATVPPAPTMLSPENIGMTTARIRFSGNGDGGSGIIRWELQRATNAAFTENAQIVTSSGATDYSDLTPGTTWYFRARGVNAIGNGSWSSTQTVTTLPATPPGMVVSPSADGTSASVALTPPSGVTGVTSYTVEHRLVGGSATSTTGASPIVVGGLTPGAQYEWRASANFGSTPSNWTGWELVFQPNPNTTPGDYFDGNSAGTENESYVWLGAANNSISVAQGVGVEGWQVYSNGNGGAPVLQRVIGGRSGGHAARMLVRAPTSGAGLLAGIDVDSEQAMAEVSEGGVYTASIYVRPSRSQRLAANVWWHGPGGGISQLTGDGVVASPGVWTRVLVTATAPPGATHASVRATDVTGSGWSTWQTGEHLDLDDAMISLGDFPYFDGSTPDSQQFEYSWLDAANASPSQRVTLSADAIDPLLDPDCPPPPAPPLPPAIEDDCIVEVGQWRRYWLNVPASQVTHWVATIPSFTLTTGALEASQVRIRVWANPDNLPVSEFVGDLPESEQIVRYMPPGTVLTIDGVSQRAVAWVGGGDPVDADHLLYGTGGAPATWPVLDCGHGYLISLDVPLEAPLGNFEASLELTRRML